MLFSAKTRSYLFIIAAVVLCMAAAYHAAGIFYQVDESPAWRHLLFICINLLCAYGFIKRPRYFFLLIAVLLVQQYYSHGSYLVRLWIERRQIHWISVFDLLLLPIALICLIEDAKMKNKERREIM